MAAPSGFRAARNLLNGRICLKRLTPPFPAGFWPGAMLLGVVAAERACVGADEPRRAAATAAAASRAAAGYAAGQSDLPHGSKRNSRLSIAGAAAIPAEVDQIRRYEDAAARQQAELDRVTRKPSGWAATVPASSRCSTASRRNAGRSTPRSSGCAEISTRSPLVWSGCAAEASAASTATISAARCWSRWRRTIAARNMPRPRAAGGNFSTICSAIRPNPDEPSVSRSQSWTFQQSAYGDATAFISRSRSAPCRARFADDERPARHLPAAEATLFSYRNPGEDMDQAVSVNGQPFSLRRPQ